jgi:hypothetical protein
VSDQQKLTGSGRAVPRGQNARMTNRADPQWIGLIRNGRLLEI